MSREEIKDEIIHVLDRFSEKALEDLLGFLKELERRSEKHVFSEATLHKIISEYSHLLQKLLNDYNRKSRKNSYRCYQ